MEKLSYSDNEFTANLIKTNMRILKDFDKRDGYKFGENNYHLLNEFERYISDISKINSELRGVFEQIQHIKIYLRRFPLRKFYYENEISETTYFKYHTEALLHKVHTISEIMKLMVNKVYYLRIPPKDCNWKNLNKKLDHKTPCLQVIENYFNVFKNLIDHRHLNTHRGIYLDKKIEDFEKYYGHNFYVMTSEVARDLFDDLPPKVLIDFELKNIKKDRLNIVDQTIRITNNQLKLFLESLNPEFENRKNILQHYIGSCCLVVLN